MPQTISVPYCEVAVHVDEKSVVDLTKGVEASRNMLPSRPVNIKISSKAEQKRKSDTRATYTIEGILKKPEDYSTDSKGISFS